MDEKGKRTKLFQYVINTLVFMWKFLFKNPGAIVLAKKNKKREREKM